MKTRAYFCALIFSWMNLLFASQASAKTAPLQNINVHIINGSQYAITVAGRVGSDPEASFEEIDVKASGFLKLNKPLVVAANGYPGASFEVKYKDSPQRPCRKEFQNMAQNIIAQRYNYLYLFLETNNNCNFSIHLDKN